MNREREVKISNLTVIELSVLNDSNGGTVRSLKSDGWGYRIHWLHLYRGVRHPTTKVLYEIKLSDGESPALKILGIWVSLTWRCSQRHFDLEW